MNVMHWSRLALAGMLIFGTGLTSCVSTRAHQTAMDEKDAELRKLREERAALKGQIQDLRSNLDNTRGELANASAKVNEDPPAKEEKRFPELDQMGIDYGMKDGHMTISIPNSISFAAGQAALSNDGKKAIKEVAALLKKQYPKATYWVEGHTDSDPIKKSKFDSNRELSVERALAVQKFLVEECSVADDDCVVAGHGQYDPVVPNDNDKNKAKNRRVEIVVHKRG
ncbi:MAG: OmpA family protein [Planctomycetes bacterium]|nr:OmpA family protein [Planctomycetota bacterium]